MDVKQYTMTHRTHLNGLPAQQRTSKLRVEQYIKGLRVGLRSWVRLMIRGQPTPLLEEVVEYAEQAETNELEELREKGGAPVGINVLDATSITPEARFGSNQATVGKNPFNPGSTMHQVWEHRKANRLCFSCGGPHRLNQCDRTVGSRSGATQSRQPTKQNASVKKARIQLKALEQSIKNAQRKAILDDQRMAELLTLIEKDMVNDDPDRYATATTNLLGEPSKGFSPGRVWVGRSSFCHKTPSDLPNLHTRPGEDRSNYEDTWLPTYEARKQQYLRKMNQSLSGVQNKQVNVEPHSVRLMTKLQLQTVSTKPFLFPSVVSAPSRSGTSTNRCKVDALLDSGCTAMVIGSDLVRQLGLTPMAHDGIDVEYADKSKAVINSSVEVTIQIGRYRRQIQFLVGNIGMDVIMGVPWIESVDVHHLRWNTGRLSFNESGSKAVYHWNAIWKQAEDIEPPAPSVNTSLIRLIRFSEVQPLLARAHIASLIEIVDSSMAKDVSAH
jgi:hypothetical protein